MKKQKKRATLDTKRLIFISSPRCVRHIFSIRISYIIIILPYELVKKNYCVETSHKLHICKLMRFYTALHADCCSVIKRERAVVRFFYLFTEQVHAIAEQNKCNEEIKNYARQCGNFKIGCKMFVAIARRTAELNVHTGAVRWVWEQSFFPVKFMKNLLNAHEVYFFGKESK